MAWRLKKEAVELAMMNKGMNLKALQEAANVSPRTLYLALRGKTQPTIGTIGKLARALGVDAAEIAENIEPEPEQERKHII